MHVLTMDIHKTDNWYKILSIRSNMILTLLFQYTLGRKSNNIVYQEVFLFRVFLHSTLTLFLTIFLVNLLCLFYSRNRPN